MNYTHYDYLELAPGATSNRIEAAYAALLERFQYGMTDAGQDLSGLVRMIHAAYDVLSDPETARGLRRATVAGSRRSRRRAASRSSTRRRCRGSLACRTCSGTLRAALPELAA